MIVACTRAQTELSFATQISTHWPLAVLIRLSTIHQTSHPFMVARIIDAKLSHRIEQPTR